MKLIENPNDPTVDPIVLRSANKPAPAKKKRRSLTTAEALAAKPEPKRKKGPGRCEVCGAALARRGNSFYAKYCKAHASTSRLGIDPVTPEQRAKGHATIRAAMALYRKSMQEGQVVVE